MRVGGIHLSVDTKAVQSDCRNSKYHRRGSQRRGACHYRSAGKGQEVKMYRERADGNGLDILCDVCGADMCSRVCFANIVVAELCADHAVELRALVESKLLTRPMDIKVASAEASVETEPEPPTKRAGQN